MLKVAFLGCLWLFGCATGSEHTVRVLLRNYTSAPLTLKGGSGLFATTITLQPGESWSGWIDRRWVLTSAWLVVESE